MDARLLGLRGRRRLLLGAGHLGSPAVDRRAVHYRPYWGFEGGGVYGGFHAGYWGPHVGFYGGINYGFGYGGIGFEGAVSGTTARSSYNRSVTNISNTHITNVYNKTVINNGSRAAFNGPGGSQARPTAAEEAAAHEQHVEPTAEQKSHFEAARSNPELKRIGKSRQAGDRRDGQARRLQGPAVPAKAAGPGAAHSAAVRAPGAEAKEKAGAKPEGEKPAAKPEGEKPAAAARHAPAHRAPAERPEGAPAPHPAAHRAAPHPAAPHPAAAPRPTSSSSGGSASGRRAAPGRSSGSGREEGTEVTSKLTQAPFQPAPAVSEQ